MGIISDSVLDALRVRLNRGDEESLAQIFEMLGPSIYRHIYFRVSSKEVAEDLSSQTFLQLWQHVRNGKAVDHVKQLVYTIAGNLVIDYYRSRAHAPVGIDEETAPQLGDHGKEAKMVEHRADIALMRNVMESMESEHRNILIWRHLDGLGIGSIAAITGKTKNAVSIILHRAMKELRDLMKAHENS